MKMTSSLHNHTLWCDGRNTPEEMADAAIAAGYTDFGFSSHGHDPTYSHSLQDAEGYIAAINKLKKEYEGRLRVYLGMESDYLYALTCRDKLDYIVGSVHNIPVKGQRDGFCIESTYEQIDAAMEYYGGDGMAIVRDFFDATVKNAEINRPDVYGHFDIILKLNKDNYFFDEGSKAYMDMAREAAKACSEVGGVFEINTGGKFSGYRDFFYLKEFLLRYLREIGARVTVSTDCHTTKSIAYGVSEAIAGMKQAGFRSLWVFEKGAFTEKDINLFE